MNNSIIKLLVARARLIRFVFVTMLKLHISPIQWQVQQVCKTPKLTSHRIMGMGYILGKKCYKFLCVVFAQVHAFFNIPERIFSTISYQKPIGLPIMFSMKPYIFLCVWLYACSRETTLKETKCTLYRALQNKWE